MKNRNEKDLDSSCVRDELSHGVIFTHTFLSPHFFSIPYSEDVLGAPPPVSHQPECASIGSTGLPECLPSSSMSGHTSAAERPESPGNSAASERPGNSPELGSFPGLTTYPVTGEMREYFFKCTALSIVCSHCDEFSLSLLATWIPEDWRELTREACNMALARSRSDWSESRLRFAHQFQALRSRLCPQVRNYRVLVMVIL